jgi:hypothetical protein
MDDPQLVALHKEALASCEGFNNKDVAAWMDPFHEDAVTYNNAFMTLAMIRPMAPTLIDSYKSFNIENVDGRRVGDTAILFGDFITEMADGSVTKGAFTFTFAKVDGEWKNLLSHYTPG